MFVVSFLIGPIFDAGHLHVLLYTGSVLSVLGFFMTSLCQEYWQFFLAQGVAMGVGFGCLYLPAPALVAMHFDHRRALAIGMSSAGSGLGMYIQLHAQFLYCADPGAGGVVFSLVFTQLQPRIGFAWTTRVLGFMLLVSSIVPLVLMRFPNRTAADAADAEKQAQRNRTPRRFVLHVWRNIVDKSAARDGPFVLLIVGLLTGFMAIYTILYYVNLFGLQRTSSSSTVASSLLVIVNGASTVGRILPSALADSIGPVNVLMLTALLSGVLVFVALCLQSAAGTIVWATAFGIVAGAFMGLPAAGVVSISRSRERIGARLGMTLGAVGCGVLVAEPIAGAILGTSSGGWPGVLGWCGALLLVGSIFMAAARTVRVGWVVQKAL